MVSTMFRTDELTLVPAHMDKHPSIQFWSNDKAKVAKVKQAVVGYTNANLGKDFLWFLQGDQPEWFMVELWSTNEDEILVYIIAMEADLGMPISVRL